MSDYTLVDYKFTKKSELGIIVAYTIVLIQADPEEISA